MENFKATTIPIRIRSLIHFEHQTHRQEVQFHLAFQHSPHNQYQDNSQQKIDNRREASVRCNTLEPPLTR